MANCKACISERVCKYNDGVNEWCKGKCPHFKHYIYYLEIPFGEMRYLTIEENEKKTAELALLLSDPDVASDYEKANELSVEIAELKEKEDELTAQWMELSEQIESFT